MQKEYEAIMTNMAKLLEVQQKRELVAVAQGSFLSAEALFGNGVRLIQAREQTHLLP